VIDSRDCPTTENLIKAQK